MCFVNVTFFKETIERKNTKIFHQDISLIEECYQGKWSPGMLTDYCWRLKREKLNTNTNK